MTRPALASSQGRNLELCIYKNSERGQNKRSNREIKSADGSVATCSRWRTIAFLPPAGAQKSAPNLEKVDGKGEGEYKKRRGVTTTVTTRKGRLDATTKSLLHPIGEEKRKRRGKKSSCVHVFRIDTFCLCHFFTIAVGKEKVNTYT